MDTNETVIRINPEQGEIILEQHENGVIARKQISNDDLRKCFLSSQINDNCYFTGILPENCIAATVTDACTIYFIRHPALHTDLTYYGTEYENFPLPRLVFGFVYDHKTNKVTSHRVCVVKDERLTAQTLTYHYPFSNVSTGKVICMGSNALPTYKSPAQLASLGSFILRIPNNDDYYSAGCNKMRMEYRELLEWLKDKDPSVYETEVLIPDGKTLGEFILFSK